MSRTIYFADRVLLFSSQGAGAPFREIRPAAGENLSRTKVLNFLETFNFVAVVTPDPEESYTSFSAQFRPVEAAGGIVVADDGSCLMIHRNGRWDLPKGHLEPDETLETCARREVAEETGVDAVVRRFLCDTFHAYELRGVWELKRTRWYELHVSEPCMPRPQTEEGIDRVCWCRAEEVAAHLKETFPTIRQVFGALRTTTSAR